MAKRIFSTKKAFKTWLNANSDARLVNQLSHLDNAEMARLYAIYQEALAMDSDIGMAQLTEKLGEAIAGLIQLVALIEGITSGADKKFFVIENVINLSRIIEKGIDGSEQNIHPQMEEFSFLDASQDSFQNSFIRPMADQAIQSLWDNSTL